MSDHQSFRDSDAPGSGRAGHGRGRDSTPDWYPTPGPWEDQDEPDAQEQVDQRYGQQSGQSGYGPGYPQPGYGPQGYAGPGQPTSGHPQPGYEPRGYAGPDQPTSGYPQTGYGPRGYGQPGFQPGGYGRPGGYGAYGSGQALRSPHQMEAGKAARVSVICAIFGFVFPIASLILGPVAISQANKARRLGGNATVGKVLGWIVTLWGGLWLLGTFTSIVFGGLAAVFGA